MNEIKIPKVIHYCWFGGKKLPPEVKRCIRTWKQYCPDYEIKRWDESNVDLSGCEFAKQAYKKNAWAFVSDYARLKIIYENGGIYLDTDVELLKNLTPLLSNDAFFGVEQKSKLINTGIGFGAVEKHALLKELLNSYENLSFNEMKMVDIACPLLNANVFLKHNFKYSDVIKYYNNYTVYPPEYFDPYAPGAINYLVSDKTYSIHHYSASWMPREYQIKRKIMEWIPIKCRMKIKQILKK